MSAPPAFSFRSTWTVPVGVDRLWDLIDGLLASDDPMAWWPAVRTESYDGDRLTVVADSRLGYRLRFALADLRLDPPHALSFVGEGELDGEGVVTITGTAGESTLLIDWTASPRPRWMRHRWLRPWLRLGHWLVMRQGRRHFVAWVRNT